MLETINMYISQDNCIKVDLLEIILVFSGRIIFGNKFFLYEYVQLNNGPRFTTKIGTLFLGGNCSVDVCS